MSVGMLSDRTEHLFTKAIEHHRAGHLAEAETLYREILAIDDRHAQAIHHLGLVAHQVGRHGSAAELIGRAIGIDDGVAEFHYNIGLVFRSLGHLEQAARHTERAIALRPDWSAAHHNLGTVLAAAGRHAAAVERYRRALALDPDMADTHFELGNTLLALGRCEQAASAYNQTLLRRPDYAQAHNNLGTALLRIGRVEEAAAYSRRALSLKPDLTEALINLASALIIQGKAEQALPFVRQSLRLREDGTAKVLFTEWIGAAQSVPTDADFRSLLVRAISEEWDRPTSFLRAIMAIVKHEGSTAESIKRATNAWPHLPRTADLFGSPGLAPLAEDQLLACLLQTGANSDIDIERFLTAARRALLEAATADTTAADDDTLGFYSRLAAQCFINEYVFVESDAEAGRALELRNSVEAALKTGASISHLCVIAIAAYMPLGTLAGAQLLLDRAWPDLVTDLLTQQIAEPAEERSYRSDIPRLTPIDDDVSIKVQRQYEENPYPRWVKAARYAPISVNAHIRGMFPAAAFRPLPTTKGVEILVAGCGTGRHAIETAELIAGSRLLAIDLSLDSLCYAMRMTRQLGIDNIEYAQADLLELGSLGRTFDVVEAGGVLHHLADPLAGWRALVALLRPDGFMHLGLYSRIARTDITAGRAFVAERGYAPTAEDIRRCRQDILAETDDPNLAKITRRSDFFTTSECRDLLFHVQEHCLTIPQIKNFLEEQELAFLGFNQGPDVRGRYSRMFPDDPSQTNLDNWHVFETEHPDSFLGMYEFWIQKKP